MSVAKHGGRQWSRRIYRVTIWCIVMFFVATSAAMLLYPGGTYRMPSYDGYDFFRNTFSELGHTTGYEGEQKWASFFLFVVATAAAGISVGAFFVAESIEARRHGANRLLSRCVALLGVIVGVSFFVIGVVPANVAFRLHFSFVYIAFTVLAPLVLAALSAWRRAPRSPARSTRLLSYGAFLVVVASYLILIYAGPPLYSESGRIIQATGQKVMVYAALVTVAAICIQELRSGRDAG